MNARAPSSIFSSALLLACGADPSSEGSVTASTSTSGEDTSGSSTPELGSGSTSSDSSSSSSSDSTASDESTGHIPGCSWSGLGPALQVDTTEAVRVELVDLDADGVLDLLTGGFVGLRVLRGVGDGTFAQTDARNLGGPPRGFAVADFDADGRLDLAASTALGPLRVYSGNGDGTLGDEVVAWDIEGIELNGLAAGDFDADGDADVAIALKGNGPGFAWGNGDGTFASDVLDAIGVSQDVIAVDLDRVEPLELVFAGYGGGAVFVARAGAYTPHPVAGAGRNVAALDLDADGFVDLVTANEARISVLMGEGEGTFGPALELDAPGSVFRFEAGDLDCDGLGDLAFVPLQGDELVVLRGTDDDGFRFEETTRVPTATAPVAVATGDVDGDGLLDVVVAGSEGGESSGPVVHLGLP